MIFPKPLPRTAAARTLQALRWPACALSAALWLLSSPLCGFAAPKPDPLGWRLGPAAWSFNRFTFFEAADKTAALGLRYLEAFEGQRVNTNSNAKLDPSLSDAAIAAVRAKLKSANVTLTSIYIHELSSEESRCRQSFEFARKLGVETIISEPKPEAMDHIERLCDEFRINVAIHNHPKGSSRYWHPQEALKVSEGRSPRIGVCADVGHWQRSGIKPADGVRRIGKRLLTLHVKDLTEFAPNGHDVPWGTGVGDIAGLLSEVHRLGVRPTLFAIEYEHNWDDNRNEIAACAKFFGEQVKALEAAAPRRDSSFTTATHAGEFKAGAAQVKITPPVGTPMAGYYSLRAATGVLDELYAKALVVEQDGAKAAFVTLDLITITRTPTVAARKLIAEQTGLSPERVMISATHTHSGPVVRRNGTLDKLTGGDTPLALAFEDNLPTLIARAVAEANARLAPARPSVTLGRAEGLTQNRRSWMKDGTVAWQPAKGDPNIVRPAGPVDAEVGVWHVAPVATYVNFPMHANIVGGERFSADFPGVLARHLAAAKGADLITLFANGCCGNINPDQTLAAPGDSPVERVGGAIAIAVTNAWSALQPSKTFAPRARAASVTLVRPKFTAADVAEARAVVNRLAEAKDMAETIALARAYCILDTLAAKDTPLEVEVQVIAISPYLAVVALPGEVFVELGLAIKKASPFKHTFIAELANGSIGYIPNRPAYAEGNYEVFSARCAEGSGETLVDTAVRLLQELHSPLK